MTYVFLKSTRDTPLVTIVIGSLKLNGRSVEELQNCRMFLFELDQGFGCGRELGEVVLGFCAVERKDHLFAEVVNISISV
jgi:hypothetical protein